MYVCHGTKHHYALQGTVLGVIKGNEETRT